ncbi:hypothetical protein [Kordia sp.]|uniref:hypothetical protein n=1 Tax=Kordia sp. TaxID=1965332 RepID=UPI003D6C4813
MRNKLIILFLSINTIVLSQELSVTHFKELNNLKAEIGKSSRKLKGAKFEELYQTYDSNVFKKTMFEYLKTTDYKSVDDYFWYSHFFMDDYYNSTINKELALEILQKGKIDIEKRLKKENLSDNEKLYLSMTRCQVLWLSGIYYFNENDLLKGGKFFDLAYENPDCIHAFPGTSKEEKEEIYKKYAEYKKN